MKVIAKVGTQPIQEIHVVQPRQKATALKVGQKLTFKRAKYAPQEEGIVTGFCGDSNSIVNISLH